MKIIFPLSFAIIFICAASSCSKDSTTTAATTTTATPKSDFSSNLTAGAWKLSSYSVNGADQTSQYSDITFNFNVNSAAEVANSFDAVDGNWIISQTQTLTTLTINLNSTSTSPATVIRFEGTWQVKSESASAISFQRNNGSGAELLNIVRK